MENKINLFRKKDTTLVYIASKELTKEIMGEDYYCDIYIHVARDKGSVIAYEENHPNKVVQLNIKIHEHILKCAEADR